MSNSPRNAPRQVRQRTVFEAGIDLLDNGVAAVGLIGCDRVQDLGIDGGEERVVPVRVKEGRLPLNGFRVQFFGCGAPPAAR